jgi:hypothetical protein
MTRRNTVSAQIESELMELVRVWKTGASTYRPLTK